MKNLSQKQIVSYEPFPTTCNICGGRVLFNACDKSKSTSGYVYYCTQCHSWVGTKPDNIREALGLLANYDIRKRRVELHRWFDKLWKNHKERANLYSKLANEMGVEEIHFSRLSSEELDKAETIIKKWWWEMFDK